MNARSVCRHKLMFLNSCQVMYVYNVTRAREIIYVDDSLLVSHYSNDVCCVIFNPLVLKSPDSACARTTRRRYI